MKKTIYLTIYEKLRNQIVNGTYEYHSMIPSKRTTAQDYHASLVSVEHAYDLLIEEGYINAVERKGYIVIYREKDFFPVPEEKQKQQNSAVISAKVTFPISVMTKAMRRTITEMGSELLMRRDNQGVHELREALARYLARSRGIHVRPDQIVITAGAESAYSLIVAMLGRFRIYGIEMPSYEVIAKMYQSEGVRLDYLKMGRKGILTKELDRTPASVLHVTPFSSYPTGVTADAGKRQEYITWAKERNAFIVEDDYASEFSPSTKTEETLFAQEPEHSIIYMNSFTKTICPSARISYLVLPAKNKEELLKHISFRVCGVSAFDQFVIAELLNNGSFERHLNRMKRQMRKQK